MVTTEIDELRKILINQKTVTDKIIKTTRMKGTKIMCSYLQELSTKGNTNWIRHTDHEDYNESYNR